MCLELLYLCGCKMKAILSFAPLLQYLLRCNLISTWTDLENLLGTYRSSCHAGSSNFLNKIIFPKNGHIKYLCNPLCLCLIINPGRQSALKHEHIFNQAVKQWEYKGHESWSFSELFCPRGQGAWLELVAVAPNVCSLAAPGCTSQVTAKNTLQGDTVDLPIPGPLLPEG